MSPSDTGPSGTDDMGAQDNRSAGDPKLAQDRAEVIAALDRLAAGTFARCDVCGVQISDKRLRMAPATDRCMDHLVDRTREHTGPEQPSSRKRDGEAGSDDDIA